MSMRTRRGVDDHLGPTEADYRAIIQGPPPDRYATLKPKWQWWVTGVAQTRAHAVTLMQETLLGGKQYDAASPAMTACQVRMIVTRPRSAKDMQCRKCLKALRLRAS